MAPAASVLQSASPFDSFLFASVGDDDKGMAVSVLSALTRLNVDPWQEAAKLAKLPRGTASSKLASVLRGLPGVAATTSDPAAIADRLISLLPRPGAATQVAPANALARFNIQPNHVRLMLALAAVLGLALALQLSIAAHPARTAQPATQSVTPAAIPRATGPAARPPAPVPQPQTGLPAQSN